MAVVERETGQLDLNDHRLFFPRILPLQGLDIRFQNGGIETVSQYGSLSDVLYGLFPHLAGTEIAETIGDIATRVRGECISTTSVEYDGARMLITGSLGKMLATGRLPEGFYTPRKIFGQLAYEHPEVDVFNQLASQAIDVDFRFHLWDGVNISDLEAIIRGVTTDRNLQLPVAITLRHIGSFSSLDIQFDNAVKFDLGVLPDYARIESWRDNTRMSFPDSSKDQYCVGLLGESGVEVSTFAQVLLKCEDASLAIEMADRAQAIVTGLRASLNRIFHPPRFNFVLPGTRPLWSYLEDKSHWEDFRKHSKDREHMLDEIQPQVTNGLLLNILCDPGSLLRLSCSHILDQVLLGDVLPDEEIKKFLDSIRPDYGERFRYGSLPVGDSGPVKLAEFLRISVPDLLPLMQLQ